MREYYSYADIKDIPNEFLHELQKLRNECREKFPSWTGHFVVNTHKRRTQITFIMDGLTADERKQTIDTLEQLLKKFKLKYIFTKNV